MTLADRLEGLRPRVLVTLGSGLGAFADEIDDPVAVEFTDIGLPGPTVPGHAGRFVGGTVAGVPILAQQGRLHLYEGVPARDVTAGVRAAADIGVEVYVATNAAGGLAGHMSPGDIVVLHDHLNLTGTSPLIGAAGSPHFVDMKDAYDPALRALASDVAAGLGWQVTLGVYAGIIGPAYETPAEVRMLRGLGADLVGMSTVSEVIAARAAGLRVLGLSLVTNVHREGGTPVDHQEVLAAGRTGGPRFSALLAGIVARL